MIRQNSYRSIWGLVANFKSTEVLIFFFTLFFFLLPFKPQTPQMVHAFEITIKAQDEQDKTQLLEVSRALKEADSLLAKGDDYAAIEACHALLRRLKVHVPVAPDMGKLRIKYNTVKPEKFSNPLRVGEILGRIAKANLHIFFERGGPIGASDDSRLPYRRENGRAALDASISLLEYARSEMLGQGGLALQYEAREVNRALRQSYDLLVESILDMQYTYGEKNVILYAFCKVLQSRSRSLLEALWAKRAIPRLFPNMPNSFRDTLSEWLSTMILRGYARSAYLMESEKESPRPEVTEPLKQGAEAATSKFLRESERLLAQLRLIDPVLLKEIQKVVVYPDTPIGAGVAALPGLGEKEVLVQYHITDNSVFAFVFPVRVQNQDRVAFVPLSVTPELLEKNIREYLQRLRKKSPFWKDFASELFLQVFADLIPYLRGKERIFIVPSGVLNYLPFQSLIDPLTEEPITTKKNPSISLLPNAELLGPWIGPSKQGPTTGRALIIGVSDFKPPLSKLLRSEDEAKAVGQALGGVADVYLDSRRQVKKDAVLNSLPKYSLIHVSSHASFDYPPMYSSVIVKDSLGLDTKITGLDFLDPQLRLKESLVTLSACDSGAVQVDRDEDPLGLASGLFIAGARTVVASLWQVNERSTEILMVKFYQELRKGATVDKALRHAQDWLRRERPEFSHPYHWGAFTVIGDGRLRLKDLGL